MKNQIMVLVVCLFSLVMFTNCADDDACEKAKSGAESKCENSGYEARNCEKTRDEQTLFYRECEYSCECYKKTTRKNSPEFVETVFDSCVRDDEGSSETKIQDNFDDADSSSDVE
jgi:hypothetical protein